MITLCCRSSRKLKCCGDATRTRTEISDLSDPFPNLLEDRATSGQVSVQDFLGGSRTLSPGANPALYQLSYPPSLAGDNPDPTSRYSVWMGKVMREGTSTSRLQTGRSVLELRWTSQWITLGASSHPCSVLERVEGVEPSSPGWKPGIIAVILHALDGVGRGTRTLVSTLATWYLDHLDHTHKKVVDRLRRPCYTPSPSERSNLRGGLQ